MARKLSKKLIDLLDVKLKDNGVFHNAIKDKDCRTALVEVAKCFVGIREATNKNDGPLVEEIQKTCGGKKGDAWCAFFVQTCIAYVELKTGIKSPVKASGSCASIWNARTESMMVLRMPKPGALCLWVHPNGKGHIGIVCAASSDYQWLVEGNTTSGLDPDGKIEREGGGCYYTKRSMNPTGDMKIRGWLKPWV